jgi:predicted aspartyl protease
VADFVIANGAYWLRVLETGCFMGATSVYLLEALARWLKLGVGFTSRSATVSTASGCQYHHQAPAPADGGST